ncbi:hypothetical protein KVR01_005841 [Diaporthe batatas]|uniref:uncharacterized protein n=1 Tax=Diaporthe batatas TaxID=748121 RepID=UPI001D048576|nr:uncharacterized protein KVR01_005841 [Diaporthe batatas]KAG8163923.1 hypothetical protein KVR01_005841 [Diaporthe batatas]
MPRPGRYYRSAPPVRYRYVRLEYPPRPLVRTHVAFFLPFFFFSLAKGYRWGHGKGEGQGVGRAGKFGGAGPHTVDWEIHKAMAGTGGAQEGGEGHVRDRLVRCWVGHYGVLWCKWANVLLDSSCQCVLGVLGEARQGRAGQGRAGKGRGAWQIRGTCVCCQSGRARGAPTRTRGTDSVNARVMVPSVAPVGLHIERQDPVRDEEMHLQPASSEEEALVPTAKTTSEWPDSWAGGAAGDLGRSHHRDPPLHLSLPLPPLQLPAVRRLGRLGRASGRRPLDISLGYHAGYILCTILPARHQKWTPGQPPGAAPFTSSLRLADTCGPKKHIILKQLRVSYPLHVARNTCIQCLCSARRAG